MLAARSAKYRATIDTEWCNSDEEPFEMVAKENNVARKQKSTKATEGSSQTVKKRKSSPPSVEPVEMKTGRSIIF